jgi:hypothetical protein
VERCLVKHRDFNFKKLSVRANKLEEKRQLGIYRRKWEDTIKMELR